jgi:short-subunit dehydrogenase
MKPSITNINTRENEQRGSIRPLENNYVRMNCIVTGASKGLGRAIAERFAAGGYNLYLCSRNPRVLTTAHEELSARYPSITVRSAVFDLAIREEVLSFGKWVLDQGIPVDVLVNNAGQFIPGNVHDEPEGALEHLIAVNLYSAYHLSRALLGDMMARKTGHIFNMCSVASLKAYPNGGAYSISKFALAGLSANLREEMKRYGIKVTTVYPGAAYTDSWAGSGIDPHRIMEAADVAEMMFTAARLSPQATVEEILLRPQLGDL